MFKPHLIVISLIAACASSRHLIEENIRPFLIVQDEYNDAVYGLKEPVSEESQIYEQDHVSRLRRQAHDTIDTNRDETSNVGAKILPAGDNGNKLSAIASIGGASGNGGLQAAGGNSALDIAEKIGMAHTDLIKETGYSATVNSNFFLDRYSSFDLKPGFSKPTGGRSHHRFF